MSGAGMAGDGATHDEEVRAREKIRHDDGDPQAVEFKTLTVSDAEPAGDQYVAPDNFDLSTQDGIKVFRDYLDYLKEENPIVQQLMETLQDGEIFELAVVGMRHVADSYVFSSVCITNGDFCIKQQQNHHTKPLHVRLDGTHDIGLLHKLADTGEPLSRNEIDLKLAEGEKLLGLPEDQQRAQIEHMSQKTVRDERFFGRDGAFRKWFARA